MACPVARFVIVTLAPLTTAPEGSITVPTMLPVPTVVWANDGREIVGSAETASTRAKRRASFPVAAFMLYLAYGGSPTRRRKSLNRGSERIGANHGSVLK